MRSFVAICDFPTFFKFWHTELFAALQCLNTFSMENSFYFSSFLLTLIHFEYLHKTLSNCCTRCNTLGWRYAFIICLMDKHSRWGGRELEFGWDLKNLNRETIGCVYLVACFFFHLNANFSQINDFTSTFKHSTSFWSQFLCIHNFIFLLF